jgi:hypothetical protein
VSALLLLMFRVLADYHDMALPLDDLAFFANRLNAGSYFHDFLLSVDPVPAGLSFHAVSVSISLHQPLPRQVIRPLVRS